MRNWFLTMRNKTNSLFRLVALGVVLTTLPFAQARGQKTLSVHLESEQDSYLVREPVKFKVVITNESGETVRVPSIVRFDMNMKHLLMEVITPAGETQYRTFKYYRQEGIVQRDYDGEPLRPGESLTTFLFPNISGRRELDLAPGPFFPQKLTFPEPGNYQLRVAYFVAEPWDNLWKPPGDFLFSNTIQIQLNLPTPVEERILDAYWAKGGVDISMGEHHAYCWFDVSALESVIEMYPDHPLIKYAYFGLGRQLGRLKLPVNRSLIERAVPIFEKLAQDYPDFRYAEVRHHLARAYYHTGRREEAIQLYSELLEERPYLIDDAEFMKSKIFVEELTSKAAGDWFRFRMSGGVDRRTKLHESD